MLLARKKRESRDAGLWDLQESRGVETRWMLEDEEPGGQSEGGGKENDGGRKGGEEEEEEEGAIGVVVCAGTEKGGRAGVGWNTPEDRKRGEGSREGEG